MEWRYLDADGVRFAYLEEGSGPLVLLIHGFPDTAHTWDAVRPALANAGYRAVSPNTRGYWPTAVPKDGDYRGDRLARDMLAFIAALGEEEAIVIGHDWGASAAYGAANLEPKRVRFLVTVAIPHIGGVLPFPRVLWGVRHFLRFRFPDADALLRRDDFRHVDELVQRWSPSWKVPAGETDAVKEAFRHPGCVEAALGYYRAISLPTRAQTDHIKVPSAVFCGDDDHIVKLSDYERARRCYDAPHTIVHMPGGHFLHREHPERFNEELLRVLPR
jgi:pimeloyl-ACP methyl ester carboxylesterase